LVEGTGGGRGGRYGGGFCREEVEKSWVAAVSEKPSGRPTRPGRRGGGGGRRKGEWMGARGWAERSSTAGDKAAGGKVGARTHG
jgi:hypothetical protein